MNSLGIHTLIQAADFLDKRPNTRASSSRRRSGSNTRSTKNKKATSTPTRTTRKSKQVDNVRTPESGSLRSDKAKSNMKKKVGRKKKNERSTKRRSEGLDSGETLDRPKRTKSVPSWLKVLESQNSPESPKLIHEKKRGRPKSIEKAKKSSAKKSDKHKSIYFSEDTVKRDSKENDVEDKDVNFESKSGEDKVTLSQEELDAIEKMIYDQLVDVQHVEEIRTTDTIPRRMNTSTSTITNFSIYNTNREAHNILEKNRRLQIKQLFDMLKSSLPLVDDKISNLKLLQFAVRQVEALRQKDHDLLRVKLELLARKRYLTKWLRELSDSMKASRETYEDMFNSVDDLLEVVESDESEMLLRPPDLLSGTSHGQASTATPTGRKRRRRGGEREQSLDGAEKDGGSMVDVGVTTTKKLKAYGSVPGKPYVRHFALPSSVTRKMSTPTTPGMTAPGQPPPLVIVPDSHSGGPPLRNRVPIILNKASSPVKPAPVGMRSIIRPLVTTNKLTMPSGRIINAQIHRPVMSSVAAPKPGMTHMVLSNGRLLDVSHLMATPPPADTHARPQVARVVQHVYSSSPSSSSSSPASTKMLPPPAKPMLAKGNTKVFGLPDPVKMSPTFLKFIESSKSAAAASKERASTSSVVVEDGKSSDDAAAPVESGATKMSGGDDAAGDGGGVKSEVKTTSPSGRLPVTDIQALMGGSSPGGVVEINNVKYLAVPLPDSAGIPDTVKVDGTSLLVRDGQATPGSSSKKGLATQAGQRVQIGAMKPVMAHFVVGSGQPVSLASSIGQLSQLTPIVLETTSSGHANISGSTVTTLPIVAPSATAIAGKQSPSKCASAAPPPQVSLLAPPAGKSANYSPVKLNVGSAATVTTST